MIVSIKQTFYKDLLHHLNLYIIYIYIYSNIYIYILHELFRKLKRQTHRHTAQAVGRGFNPHPD